MIKDKTDLKCAGCKSNFPKDTSKEAYNPTYYDAYDGQDIIELPLDSPTKPCIINKLKVRIGLSSA